METCKDFILKMTQMDKAEQFVIAGIVHSWTPESSIGSVVIKTTDMSSADANKFIKGIKTLTAKGLVRRIKRSHYMMHPKTLVPRDKELAMETWEGL